MASISQQILSGTGKGNFAPEQISVVWYSTLHPLRRSVFLTMAITMIFFHLFFILKIVSSSLISCQPCCLKSPDARIVVLTKSLVVCYATLHPAVSVGWLVGWSDGPPSTFLRFWAFWAYCSYSNAQVTSITATAHPRATGVAVYPALFSHFPFLKMSLSAMILSLTGWPFLAQSL